MKDTGLESLNIYCTNVQVHDQLLRVGKTLDKIQLTFEITSFQNFIGEKKAVLLSLQR